MTIASREMVDLLLQFAPAQLPEQIVTEHECRIEGAVSPPLAAHDSIGERIWARCDGQVCVTYRATVKTQRIVPDLAEQRVLSPSQLPGEAVAYLFESRYCHSARFQTFVADRFGSSTGGTRVQAIRDWVAAKIAYTPGTSDTETNASHTFLARQGVCRDFAHVVIAMARASDIPARFVSCYAPRVTPQDFHAVAEVFLADPAMPSGGYWHLVDATGMAEPHEIVKIGVGRDAADVSFLTSFGAIDLIAKNVSVHETETVDAC